MKMNMGTTDRIIRTIIALVLAILYFMEYFTGIWSTVVIVVIILLVATSAVGSCPLYMPFKFSSMKKDSGEA